MTKPASATRGAAVSFRIRRAYFDLIKTGEKTVEVRRDTPYWRAVQARAPTVAVFVCGQDVHRRQLLRIADYASPEAVLGRSPSPQGLKDVGSGPVLGFHLGEVL